MRATSLIAVVSLMLGSIALADEDQLIVHEWGTFTSLQDVTGRTVAGINSDDEPLPDFVHKITPDGNLPQSQGFTQSHPSVTMRLETPVLYVYPDSHGGGELPRLSVEAQFHGGLLTQYYPAAEPGGLATELTSRTLGRLSWRGLKLGGDAIGPRTDSHVWTAPRHPKSLTITNDQNESEKYLFYRGVGHILSPLKAIRTGADLQIQPQFDPVIPFDLPLVFSRLWYCVIHQDGTCAWRRVDPAPVADAKTGAIATTAADFEEERFSKENMAALRNDMHEQIVAAGLSEDEATAMLDTWELSYFKSWGARLFFIVPRKWTDDVLPIKIEPAPIELHRVMIGRIDLITDTHRELLDQIASANQPADPDKLWQMYQSLGRFRNALVLDRQELHPSAPLARFITSHNLQTPGQ